MERPAGVLPEGYEEVYDYTWGFLDILVMFEQVLGPDVALQAAIGWGGGRSLVGYSEEGEVVLVWEHAGDSPGSRRSWPAYCMTMRWREWMSARLRVHRKSWVFQPARRITCLSASSRRVL